MPRNPANHHQGPAPRPKMATAHDGSDHQAFINSLWGNVPSRVGSSSTPASKPASTSKSSGGSYGGSSRRAAPADPIRSWTNEELAAGAYRQGAARDRAAREIHTSDASGMRDAANVRIQTANDSSSVINNEIERRSREVRARARKNNQ